MDDEHEWNVAEDVYYRIIAEKNVTGSITSLEICPRQWFDEYGVDPSIYYSDEKFQAVEEAQAVIDRDIAFAAKLMPVVLARLGIR